MTLDEFLRALPKIELHCHLYGAVRKETFSDLAVRTEGADDRRANRRALYTPRKPWPTNDVLRALDEHLVPKGPDDLLPHLPANIWTTRPRTACGTRSFSGIRPRPCGPEFRTKPRSRPSCVPSAIARCALDIVARLIPAIDRERGPAAALEMVKWVGGPSRARGPPESASISTRKIIRPSCSSRPTRRRDAPASG